MVSGNVTTISGLLKLQAYMEIKLLELAFFPFDYINIAGNRHCSDYVYLARQHWSIETTVQIFPWFVFLLLERFNPGNKLESYIVYYVVSF